jgi:hypothetical protein
MIFLIPHNYPPQQVVKEPLRAGMDSGAVNDPATSSILNRRRLAVPCW